MKRAILLLIMLVSYTTSFTQKLPEIEGDFNYEVEITTNIGKINIFLYNETPLHRDNFVKLADFEFYNEILFHRVIKGFVIQAGDPESREHKKFVQYGEGEYKYGVEAEILPQFHHTRGAVGMAREGDDVNPDRESSGSHFYIVQGHNEVDESKFTEEHTPEIRQKYLSEGGAPHLDGKYTIFGYVVSGMDVVDKIADMETDSNDRPIYDAVIENVRVFKKR